MSECVHLIHFNLPLALIYYNTHIYTYAGSFTKSLVPLANFTFPPKPPTLELTEFQSNCKRDTYPYITFCNHLFVYPQYLQFDSQKFFSRARNITVVVELRDSDEEGSKPLKVCSAVFKICLIAAKT